MKMINLYICIEFRQCTCTTTNKIGSRGGGWVVYVLPNSVKLHGYEYNLVISLSVPNVPYTSQPLLTHFLLTEGICVTLHCMCIAKTKRNFDTEEDCFIPYDILYINATTC